MKDSSSTDKAFISIGRATFWALLISAFVGLFLIIGQVDYDPWFRTLPFSIDPDAPLLNGPIGFSLFATAAIMLSCPRQVVSFFAGYFFGLTTGLVAALVATTVSCILVYGLSVLLQERVRPFIKGRVRFAVDFWAENTFWATVLWRFIPAGSNLVTNMAAGVLNIPARRFFAGSALGYIPHTLVFVLIGSGLKVESGTQIIVSGVLLAISGVIGFVLYRNYQQKTEAET